MMYTLTPLWRNHVLIPFFLSIFLPFFISFFLSFSLSGFFIFFFGRAEGVNCMMPHPSTHVQSGCGGTCQRHIDRGGHATTCSGYLMDGAQTWDGGISNYWREKMAEKSQQSEKKTLKSICTSKQPYALHMCNTCPFVQLVFQNSCSNDEYKKKRCVFCFMLCRMNIKKCVTSTASETNHKALMTFPLFT